MKNEEFTQAEKIEQLKALASDVKNEEYQLELTDEELDDIRLKLVNELIEVDNLKDEVKQFTDIRKTQIASLDKMIEQRKEAVKNGVLEAKGDLYYCPNMDEKTIYVYNADYRLIRTEPLTTYPMFSQNGQPFSNEKENNVEASFGDDEQEEENPATKAKSKLKKA